MRHYLKPDFKIETAEDISAVFRELLSREINSPEDYNQFLNDVSEVDSHVSEDMAWRYIRMTCDTKNEENEKRYLTFVQEIQPALAPLEDQLNRKIAENTFADAKTNDTAFFIYHRSLKSAIELFREENIPLQAELSTLAQEYSSIQGAMSIEWEGQEITLQKASNFLMEPNRELREEIWHKIQERRAQDIDSLESIFDKMVQKRHQLALNAGFENYRDYMFKAMGRFDYTSDDCKAFHSAIEHHVVPLLKQVQERRKSLMQLDSLKPWDTSVDPLNRPALKPFTNGQELLDRGIHALNQLDPFFGGCLTTMKNKQLLDLESRVGKAPGGYNYPLAETNMPFIFMNATGNLRDVETLVHEAGHAIHSFQMAPLPLNAYKNTPSEVAELASMSMELLSMEGWNYYFSDHSELERAKAEQIEGIIGTLPWIATVDAFQHWVYEHPNHSREERKEAWKTIQKRFSSNSVDYTGYETALDYAWHKQLHIFEVPFYYVEYGFAQLGAIGIWKNYHENRQTAIEHYKHFMTLGYTQSIPEIYQAAGVKFEFSADYIRDLMIFVNDQWLKTV